MTDSRISQLLRCNRLTDFFIQRKSMWKSEIKIGIWHVATLKIIKINKEI